MKLWAPLGALRDTSNGAPAPCISPSWEAQTKAMSLCLPPTPCTVEPGFIHLTWTVIAQWTVKVVGGRQADRQVKALKQCLLWDSSGP
jgi:hypothetical protein